MAHGADRKIYIHTNSKQLIGALVARYTLQRNSRKPDRFDVEIILAESFPSLRSREGMPYLRENETAIWRNGDLQSFAPLRFAVPELMGYAGRAVVIDPGVFALGDINDLLDADMDGAAVLARRMEPDAHRPLHFASSVMLLDCARLRHWQLERDFSRLFTREVDYRDWMWLLQEQPGIVGTLAPGWNAFDRLTPATKLLHNTHRRTQPWKTGLPVDYTKRGRTLQKKVSAVLRGLAATMTGISGMRGFYRAHPDPAQEHFFFRMLGECLEQGIITERQLRTEIQRRHIRADALERARAVRRGALAYA
ncbi:MAG: hypothetical protein ABW110_06005 [Steroidobacteraceae bacterium]